jgi:hypothetical protein
MKSNIIDLIDKVSLNLDYIKAYKDIIKDTIMYIDSDIDMESNINILYTIVYALSKTIDDIDNDLDYYCNLIKS